MCRPISIIITEDKIFLSPEKVWNHSHSSIMENHNIPDGLIGDKYLRLEVLPPEECVFRDKKTNKKLIVNKKWKVKVDEDNIPDWYSNDKPNQEDRAREAAKKWFINFPDNLLDGYKEVAGDNAKLISGHDSILTAGSKSTLTAGDYSTLTSGHNSTLTAGYCSKLTAGHNSILTTGYNSTLNAGIGSTLTSGHNSIFCAGEGSSFSLIWYDGKRSRTTVAYVGEDGIKPDTKYLGKDGKFTKIKE